MKVPTLARRQELRERPEDMHPLIKQEWKNILFLHWEYPAEAIQAQLPPGLKVDLFQNKAYVTAVPFLIKNARLRYLPRLKTLTDTMELSLRTYVYDENGCPGVWFFSVDSNRTVISNTGKRLFNLPFHRATMRNEQDEELLKTDFLSHRNDSEDEYILRYMYEPEGTRYFAEAESIEYFTSERYIFFSYIKKEKQLYYHRVYHDLFPLKKAIVSEYDDNIFGLNNMDAPVAPPVYAFMSCGIEVEIYPSIKL